MHLPGSALKHTAHRSDIIAACEPRSLRLLSFCNSLARRLSTSQLPHSKAHCRAFALLFLRQVALAVVQTSPRLSVSVYTGTSTPADWSGASRLERSLSAVSLLRKSLFRQQRHGNGIKDTPAARAAVTRQHAAIRRYGDTAIRSTDGDGPCCRHNCTTSLEPLRLRPGSHQARDLEASKIFKASPRKLKAQRARPRIDQP